METKKTLIYATVIIFLIIVWSFTSCSSLKKVQERRELTISHIVDTASLLLKNLDEELLLLDDELTENMKKCSNELTNSYFSNSENIQTVDLEKIREELKMDPDLADIYIIDESGVIVNTTYIYDLGLNMYNFGANYKNYLLTVFNDGEFTKEGFSYTMNHRLIKYTYQPTLDKNYIIELCTYSLRADELIQFLIDSLNLLAANNESIISLDLFVDIEDPFSLNHDISINRQHSDILRNVFIDKESKTIIDELNGESVKYYFIHIGNSQVIDINNGYVIRITMKNE